MKPAFTIALVSLAWMNADAYYDPFFDVGYNRTALGDAIDKATLKILKETYEISEDKNVIASPLAVLLLLSLYSNGAGRDSRQEINNILGGGDYKQLTESYTALSNHFNAMDPSYLTLANKIYVSDQYELNDTFANTARSYKSEVEKLDFTNAKKAAKTINAWSNEKTKGNIKNPVPKSMLTPDILAGLFNVIFFQGHWLVPFTASDTEDKDFHVDKTTIVKKPTMKIQHSLLYTEIKDLGAKMIELPYKEIGFRMVVVLPNEVDGLASVLEKATQKGLLEDIFRLGPDESHIHLEIPKFEIKSKLDLNKILPKVGVLSIFGEPAPGIVNDNTVRVSKVFQEAFVKVDEEGSTAGAFTYFSLLLDEAPPPSLKFIVDRPFLFYILYEDKTLFAGTYTH